MRIVRAPPQHELLVLHIGTRYHTTKDQEDINLPSKIYVEHEVELVKKKMRLEASPSHP